MGVGVGGWGLGVGHDEVHGGGGEGGGGGDLEEGFGGEDFFGVEFGEVPGGEGCGGWADDGHFSESFDECGGGGVCGLFEEDDAHGEGGDDEASTGEFVADGHHALADATGHGGGRHSHFCCQFGLRFSLQKMPHDDVPKFFWQFLQSLIDLVGDFGPGG